MIFKKKYGQHFLCDKNIAKKMVKSLLEDLKTSTLLEIGPGHGILTVELFKINGINIKCVEIDPGCNEWLKKHYPEMNHSFINDDFLEYCINEPVSIIGNFPYNISSQILFKILESRNHVPLLVGMFQKEVAERIVSQPDHKTYGILSVLLQTFFVCEYLFTVEEKVFMPVPKVKSAVIKLKRNDNYFSEQEFQSLKYMVKKAFGQRRKMLRNSLLEFLPALPEEFKTKRHEQLSIADFIELNKRLNEKSKGL